MELRSEHLLLRPVSMNFLDEIHHLHSLPETDEFNTTGIPQSVEVTKNIILEWIENQEAIPRKSYVFCSTLIETNQFIGLIGLNIGKTNYRIAETWFKTQPGYWKKGYTTEALFEMLKFGFLTLGLHRIEAGCAVENTASIRLLEKAGFKREGRKKEILPIRGKWIDNYFYAILEREFIKINN
ncbi:MAG TPA: GNAT family protein [Ferruginibacter sp.]|nr:GNAT family protein [Ferruginibacter sp.]